MTYITKILIFLASSFLLGMFLGRCVLPYLARRGWNSFVIVLVIMMICFGYSTLARYITP